MIIRRAVPADVEAIARVHIQAWQESYRGLIPDAAINSHTLEQRLSRWTLTLQNPDILVYLPERDGAVCGFVSFGEARPGLAAEGEVYSFHLLQSIKRQGVGRALFTQLCNELRARGVTSLGLWVLPENTPARRFYEAMGGRLGESRLDRRGEFVFDEVAYIWGDLAPFAAG